MARPPKGIKYDKSFTIWLEESVHTKLDLAARMEGITKCECIRRFVKKELDKQAEKINRFEELLNQ